VTNDAKIPFLDLVAPHREMEEELVSVFRQALGTGGFVGGPMVAEFEQEFAKFCDVRNCVGVNSGTDALRFALIAAGVKPGDTVVTVPNTFVATAEAISQTGARPDFVDIEASTYNMDPRKLEEYLEKRCHLDSATGKLLNKDTGSCISAIVPVHLFGHMADMDPILQLAERYTLIVIEDACQAHGAEYFSRKQNRWIKAGAMGVAAAFSFYPGKNLGACGEAGAVTTNNPELAEKVRMLRDHGQSKKYCHEMEGYNGRLDAIQAGILRAKLHYLVDWNEKRRAIALRYNQLFRPHISTLILPYEPPYAKAVYHLYVIRVANRDQLQSHLTHANIATQVHYPTPIHLQRAYAALGHKTEDFPVAERAANEILSLPMYPQLDTSQQIRIARELTRWLAGRANGSHDHSLGSPFQQAAEARQTNITP
jgi:dTDP-4-amino-4,6-dideoxygalactose transaminase